MDNPNPIRYSDLITPDDSIQKLIAQLDELIQKYESAKSKIQGAAAEAAKSMGNLSGATEEQRQQIALLTTESDKLAAAYKKSNDAESETYRRRQQVIAAVKEQQRIDKLVVELNNSKEGSYNRLSAQYRLNKIRLNEMSEAQRHGTETGRKLEAETKAIYERMNQLQLATGKAQLQVGHYEKSLGSLLGVNSRLVSVLTDTEKATEAVSGTMRALASPIGIAVGVIGGLVAAFKLFQSSIHETQTTGDAFDYAVGEWTGTWDVFKKAVASVDFHGFIVGATEAAIAGRNLKMTLDDVFERTNSTRILRASMSEENAILEEAMRNSKLSYEEREKAANQYLKNMQPIYEQEKETARRVASDQLEYLFSVTNRTKYATKKQREAAKQQLANYIKEYSINEDRIKIAQQYLQAEEDISAAEAGLKKAQSTQMTKYYDEQRQAARKRLDEASEETKELAKIVKQYNLTNNEQVQAYVAAEENYQRAKSAAYNDQKRIVTMRNNLEAQANNEAIAGAKARKKASEDEAKAAKEAAEAEARAREAAAREAERQRQQEIADQRAILNAQLQSIQLQIAATQEGTTEMLNLRIAMIQKQNEIEKFENAQKKKELRQDEKAIDAKYNTQILRENAKFNETLAKRDLAALQDYQQAEFDLLDTNERQKTLFRLEQEKARLEAILKMDETATEKMTKMEVDAIKKSIEAISKQTQRTGYKNFYELFGIGMDSDQQSALNTALSSVKDSIGSLVDSWNKAAEAATNAAEAQVDAAKTALDAEIEARNAGYANAVETAQKELDLAKKNQEKAMNEQKKAQQAQLTIDSITQASSLITATANIWKAFSGTTIGAGLAVAAIATMWGSFAAAKIRAAQLTKPTTEEYGEGTVELLQGGSHASGHDIDLGTKPNGTRRRAEGGEFFAVINKRNSRRFRDIIPDVINSFNDGTFADRYQRANAAMSGYAVQLMGGAETDVSGLERDVAAIRKQGDRTQYVDGRGNVIYRYKNLTRKVTAK